MLVGEQPGDREDVTGRPFVGPAGSILDRALEEAALERTQVYITNAVKHFKYEMRGKRRLHKRPNTEELLQCQPWLEREIEIVKPSVIVALGATAARSVLGQNVTISKARREAHPLTEQRVAFVTIHPSFLLRQIDPADKAREYRAFVADLRRAKEHCERYHR
jgi:uracil-DNA glycosylase